MKTKKSARKFAASGKLKKVIEARHKHQKIKKKMEGRRGQKGKATAKGKAPLHSSNAKPEDEEDEEEDVDMQDITVGKANLSDIQSEDEADGGAGQVSSTLEQLRITDL